MNVREWALPVYTILVELATGSFLILWILRSVAARKLGRQEIESVMENPLSVVLFTIVTAMVAAHLHLSRPYLSFLAVRNFATSWLSREIVFNMIYMLLMAWLWYLVHKKSSSWWLKTVLGWAAILFGLATVYCMANIYRLDTQIYWNTPFTTIAFYLTSLLLGFMTLTSLLVMDLKYSEILDPEKASIQIIVIRKSLAWFVAGALLSAILVIVEFGYQLLILNHATDKTAQVSLQLITRLYPVLLGLRFSLVVLGVLGLLLMVVWQKRFNKSVEKLFMPAYVTCLLVMIGEILGRFIFYATHVRTGL